MKVVTSSQMKAIDRRTIEEHEIPGLELMERAGQGIFEFVVHEFGHPSSQRLLVLCGRGNNGGDGFVLARKLVEVGGGVKVFLLGMKSDVRGDAKANLERLESRGSAVHEIFDEEGWKKVEDALNWCTLKMDALLGTGGKGPLGDELKRAVTILNSSATPCISIDIPTGIDADTGSIESACVRADLTVTMAAVKKGLLFYPAKKHAGKIRVVDIGVPEKAYSDEKVSTFAIDGELAQRLLPKRSPTAHKGECGRVLVVGGSRGMSGAIHLAAQSAMRAGAGLVYAGVPESLNDILEVKMTESLTFPLPETKERSLSLSALEKVLEMLPGFDALALGPGLSRNDESAELARRLVQSGNIPTVLDADGLNAFEGNAGLLKDCKSPLSITPHGGEMARLLGKRREEVEHDRISAVEFSAREFSCVCLLKGAPTLVAVREKENSISQTYINTTGSEALATAGSGDVLTGAILAFLGQGLSVLDATLLGAYVHGLAGEIAEEEKGIWGVLASDVMESIPAAMKRIPVSGKNEA